MHQVNHTPELVKEMKEFVVEKLSDMHIAADAVDDEWFSFNDNIDINIWDDDGDIRAAAYDVIDSHTNTDSWTQLLP